LKKWNFLLIGALTLSLVACNSEEQVKSDTSIVEVVGEGEKSKEIFGEEKSVTFVDAIGQEHEFAEPPKSIATLNPGIMDILVQLEANVTGRPKVTTDLSADLAKIQEIGNPHEPSFEQIVALNPEVLIVPPSFQRFANTITATGIEVVYEEVQSIQEIQDTITRYGELFRNKEKAAQLNKEIDEAVAQKVDSTKNALIVYGAPGTFLAALDTSLYGDMLKAVGVHNIAADLPKLDQYPNYASLSAEKIVEGNPEFIMLITHSNPEVVKKGFEQQMNQNAAWKNLDAVKNNNIIILPSELFDNPGTQIVEALEYMRNVFANNEGSN